MVKASKSKAHTPQRKKMSIVWDDVYEMFGWFWFGSAKWDWQLKRKLGALLYRKFEPPLSCARRWIVVANDWKSTRLLERMCHRNDVGDRGKKESEWKGVVADPLGNGGDAQTLNWAGGRKSVTRWLNLPLKECEGLYDESGSQTEIRRWRVADQVLLWMHEIGLELMQIWIWCQGCKMMRVRKRERERDRSMSTCFHEVKDKAVGTANRRKRMKTAIEIKCFWVEPPKLKANLFNSSKTWFEKKTSHWFN